MSDQVPVNTAVTEPENGGFALEWFLYLERLKDAKITEDFTSLPTLDGSSTLADVIDAYNQLRAILAN